MTRCLVAGIGMLMLGCTALLQIGCAARDAEPRVVAHEVPADGSGFEEIDSLYALATSHTRREVRKAVRDRRDRAMRMLADETRDRLAAFEVEVRPVLLSGQELAAGPQSADALADYREALSAVQSAAQNRNARDLKHAYAALTDARARLQHP